VVLNDGTDKNGLRGRRVVEFDRVQAEVAASRGIVANSGGGHVFVSGPVIDSRNEICGFVHVVLAQPPGVLAPRSSSRPWCSRW
jgi:hypothetical protein